MRILYHILYPDGMGDDRFIYDGYKFAFESLGHEVRPLTERHKIEDLIKEFKPDLFITRQSLLHEKFIGNVEEFFKKIKNFRLNGGKIIFEIGHNMSKELIKIIKEGNVADVFFIHGAHPNPPFKEITGHDFYNIPLAASRQYHFPTKPVEKYKCDIVYVGANLPHKREAFKRRLWPLFKKYKVRVYGSDWDMIDRFILHPLAKIDRVFNWGGFVSRARLSRQVSPAEENKVYASAKICLNFHEDHQIRLVNGRTFKIAASGGFQICNWEPLVRNFFGADEVIMPENELAWFTAIDYYLKHPEDRKKIQEKATKKALVYHTFHNRVQDMLSWLK